MPGLNRWARQPEAHLKPPFSSLMVTDHDLLTDTFEHRIHEHLQAGEVREARDLLVVRPPADRVDILAELPVREMVGLFRSLPVAVATETFVYADAGLQHQLLGGLCAAALNATGSEGGGDASLISGMAVRGRVT